MSEGRSGRRRRADGEESRRRILDAAAEIAGERGYEGTSIATVSARSGLPASSIYWYFADKDALIAAVIERSFDRWLAAMSLPGPEAGTPRERMTAMAVAVAKALLDTPDFLRLGLMLTLEHRSTEPTARSKFLQVRQIAHQRVTEAVRELAPDLSEASVRAADHLRPRRRRRAVPRPRDRRRRRRLDRPVRTARPRADRRRRVRARRTAGPGTAELKGCDLPEAFIPTASTPWS